MLIASVYTINIKDEPSLATSLIDLLVTSLMYPRYINTTAPDTKLDIKFTVTVISESLKNNKENWLVNIWGIDNTCKNYFESYCNLKMLVIHQIQGLMKSKLVKPLPSIPQFI